MKAASSILRQSHFSTPKHSVRAATRVNAEQAPKRSMCRPTRLQLRGRLIRLGEMSEDDAQSLHRGTGGSTYMKESARNTGSPRAWSGQG